MQLELWARGRGVWQPVKGGQKGEMRGGGDSTCRPLAFIITFMIKKCVKHASISLGHAQQRFSWVVLQTKHAFWEVQHAQAVCEKRESSV